MCCSTPGVFGFSHFDEAGCPVFVFDHTRFETSGVGSSDVESPDAALPEAPDYDSGVGGGGLAAHPRFASARRPIAVAQFVHAGAGGLARMDVLPPLLSRPWRPDRPDLRVFMQRGGSDLIRRASNKA